jgi:hypothetical protein
VKTEKASACWPFLLWVVLHASGGSHAAPMSPVTGPFVYVGGLTPKVSPHFRANKGIVIGAFLALDRAAASTLYPFTIRLGL